MRGRIWTAWLPVLVGLLVVLLSLGVVSAATLTVQTDVIFQTWTIPVSACNQASVAAPVDVTWSPPVPCDDVPTNADAPAEPEVTSAPVNTATETDIATAPAAAPAEGGTEQ
jgi:hypothetical protein